MTRREKKGEEWAEEGSRNMEERHKRTREKSKDTTIVENVMVF